MLSFLLKYRQICLLALCALLGLACSQLAMVLLGMAGRGKAPAPLLAPLRPADRAAPETELAFILQHNLFDQTARSTTSTPFSLQAGETSVAQGDLELVGTVVAGSRSLAMLRTGQEQKIYRLGVELPGGKLEEVARHQISIRNHNGS